MVAVEDEHPVDDRDGSNRVIRAKVLELQFVTDIPDVGADVSSLEAHLVDLAGGFAIHIEAIRGNRIIPRGITRNRQITFR